MFFNDFMIFKILFIDSLVQDCSNSIANARELPQSCTEPMMLYIRELCFITAPVMAPFTNIV